ncbi:MAG: aggregation factor core [Pseudomonadota bacterium]
MASNKLLFIAMLVGITFVAPANADLVVRFDEGAPKDRFTFLNNGECTLEDAVIRLDLSTSTAGLIFDTTDQGAGVEVFQPLQLVSGKNSLKNIPTVKDGDQSVHLEIDELTQGQSIAFTIDVDDTAGGREITVSDSEISGAVVEFSKNASSISASFEAAPETVLKMPTC